MVSVKGDGAHFSPLDGSGWVTGNKEQLMNPFLKGLEGPTTVKGQPFNCIMPNMIFFKDAENAKVFIYIRLNFTNNLSISSEEELATPKRKCSVSKWLMLATLSMFYFIDSNQH